ncbi:hypothetical protein [Magnetospira sp. QH-2]|uniref:DUF6898 family protein n=1 Tax=Magnetospira sp. (strain QH-2) TaxID=1288970 RepID=UPI0003E81870|nr:hypothetical protein [Magnetospira sp. QH-2]CCQ73841.1 Conserved protein of unknown function [Magnetospira sp. QH-2]
MRKPLSEVLIEFYHVGKYVKVSAIDPVSNTEVSIVGDPKRSKKELIDVAKRKLQMVLERKQRNQRNSL